MIDDFVKEIDDLRCENSQLVHKNKKLKEETTIMGNYLELIADLSFDYDGCNSIKSLKKLIDELNRIANLGIECNLREPIYVNRGKKYNILQQEIENGDGNE